MRTGPALFPMTHHSSSRKHHLKTRLILPRAIPLHQLGGWCVGAEDLTIVSYVTNKHNNPTTNTILTFSTLEWRNLAYLGCCNGLSQIHYSMIKSKQSAIQIQNRACVCVPESMTAKCFRSNSLMLPTACVLPRPSNHIILPVSPPFNKPM